MNELEQTSGNKKGTKVKMQNQITPIEQYVPGSNFNTYEVRLRAYYKVNDIPEDNKVNVLITLLPNQVVEKLISLCEPAKIQEKSWEQCLEILREFYTPKRNVIIERFEFKQSKQETNETIREFIVKLKRLAMTCEFEALLDENLRDQFIIGLKDSSVQKMLLMESSKKEKLTFVLASSLAVATELSEAGVSGMRSQSARFVVAQVDGIFNNNNRSPSVPYSGNFSYPRTNKQGWKSGGPTMKNCIRCGTLGHDQAKCSANNFNCRKCGKKGHYEKVCRSRAIKNIITNEESYQEEEDYVQTNFNWIGSLKNGNNGLFIKVQVDGTIIKMEIDTGSCSSVMTEDKFREYFPNNVISHLGSSLYTVTGQCIGIIGKSNVKRG